MHQIIGNKVSYLIISIFLFCSCEINSAEKNRITPFIKELKSKFPKSNFSVDDEGMYRISFWGNRESIDNWYLLFDNKGDSISSISFRNYQNIPGSVKFLATFKNLKSINITNGNLTVIPSFIYFTHLVPLISLMLCHF